MKVRLLPLLFMFLLASCTISKRRYMGGYSFNWKHSSVKTTTSSNTQTTHIAKQQVHLAHPARVQPDAPVLPGKNISPAANTKQTPHNNTLSISAVNTIETQQANNNKTDFYPGIPGHGTSAEQEVCHEANVSLTWGILTWMIPSALIALALAVAIADAPVSGGWSFLILIPAVVIGGIFAVIGFLIALTSGATALSKIKENPEKYTGKWRAIVGIILAASYMLLVLIAGAFILHG